MINFLSKVEPTKIFLPFYKLSAHYADNAFCYTVAF